ncbi:hypothetical protein R3P38DRAFT_3373014 [Favolaschia claudopus]|uniref:Uncharacterized protein n=1 Tax=Favolaschia claudopus TaxID=2862362 RepID=A0AAV9ZU30_9AGAR
MCSQDRIGTAIQPGIAYRHARGKMGATRRGGAWKPGKFPVFPGNPGVEVLAAMYAAHGWEKSFPGPATATEISHPHLYHAIQINPPSLRWSYYCQLNGRILRDILQEGRIHLIPDLIHSRKGGTTSLCVPDHQLRTREVRTTTNRYYTVAFPVLFMRPLDQGEPDPTSNREKTCRFPPSHNLKTCERRRLPLSSPDSPQPHICDKCGGGAGAVEEKAGWEE